MAEFTLILIPNDRHYAPSAEAIATASKLLADFFPDRGGEVQHRLSRGPRFVTSGDNLEGFACPGCKQTLDRFELEEEDGGEWWGRFEHEAGVAADATAVVLVMPCCGQPQALTAIDFKRDAGIARFQLSVFEPGDATRVNAAQLAELERALGCQLVQITSVSA